ESACRTATSALRSIILAFYPRHGQFARLVAAPPILQFSHAMDDLQGCVGFIPPPSPPQSSKTSDPPPSPSASNRARLPSPRLAPTPRLAASPGKTPPGAEFPTPFDSPRPAPRTPASPPGRHRLQSASRARNPAAARPL